MGGRDGKAARRMAVSRTEHNQQLWFHPEAKLGTVFTPGGVVPISYDGVWTELCVELRRSKEHESCSRSSLCIAGSLRTGSDLRAHCRACRDGRR